MRRDASQISVCLDSNVIISAVAFGGKPLEVLHRALCREFYLVIGPNIISEVSRNLVQKLALDRKRVQRVLDDILAVASSFVPSGRLNIVSSAADNLVLEVADVGGCDVLVTGDRKHLLPLGSYKGIIIEPPSAFLTRLNSIKTKGQ